MNSKADGSTVTELETKASTIEQNLNGVTTKVANLESTSEGFDTRLTAAESKITDDAIVSTVTSSTVYKDALSGKVDTSAYNTKMEQLDNSISLKATATEVYTKTQADAAFDAKGSASNAKSEAISSAKSYTDTATTDMATKEYVTSQGYLTVTSDAITSKVSKNEVISAINQTAESVSIDASKINLNGAVTFTSFDSSLQTTINNKAETSDLEAVRTTANNAQTSIDNLEIGGRNYITKISDRNITSNGITVEVSDNIVHIYGTNTKTDTAYSIGSWAGRAGIFEPEAVYTISTTTPLPRGLYLGVNTKTTSGTSKAAGDYSYLYGNGISNSTTFTCRSDSNGDLNGFFGVTANCGTVDVTFKIKLEKGNRATDWTPAPEDVDAGIANAQTSIDNLEIGGRNLLPFETWSEQVGSVYEKENGTFSITSFGNYHHKPYVFGEVGETYTISVDAVTQDSTNPRVIVGIYDGSTFKDRQYIRLGETPTNWETLATRNDINAVRLDYSSFSAPFIVKNLKIEKGDKATDWTPAPEDVDANISEAQDNALTAQEATGALDVDFSDFKSNEYAQINDEVGGLVNYKESNEKVITNIKEELSQELVAKKFARIENGSLILGATNSTTAVLTNEQFGFYTPNSEVPASYFGKDGDVWAFNIERGIVTNDLRFNGFQWISRANKNMSLKWLD